MDKAGTATRPEDIFVELFAQVFGLEKAERLSHEFGVLDIYNQPRRIDYALEIAGKRIAFEIDGLAWHHPNVLSVFEYEDQILRQNSLVADGWRVFRWTDHEIVEEPDRVKEELARFLEAIPGLLDDADFLPKRECVQFDLFEHQQETLDYLAQQRSIGKTMALVLHATGAGKTVTAINDARRIGLRTLYVAHTTNLVKQTARAFRQHWPEAHTGIYSGSRKEAETHIVSATIQSLSRNLEKFSPDDFGYIIIDEAHHAPADTYGRILSFFTPRFILGLTATPERPDSQSVLDLFETSAHRLTLEQAIETGCLVPIRCFRVKTNVDLSHVRYNRIQYNRRDIEKSIRLPGRNRLIVDTYLKHVRGRRAVVFCVSVQHADDVAALFNEKGITAASVSGLLSVKKRDEVLAAFRDNKLSILCACDILNEGWDCPEVEVLMMARPTLSKIIYMQQLGRGTRCAPGKKSLLVIDFVDNASRYNVSLNLHRIFGKKKYIPGGLVIAPQEMLEQEQNAIHGGSPLQAIVDINIWARNYEEIDVFNWQQIRGECLSSSELELELACSSGIIRKAVEKKVIMPDHTVLIGNREYYFFDKKRVEEVRQTLNLPRVTAENILEMFMDFVSDMNMSFSYKPVFLLAMFDNTDKKGRVPIDAVLKDFLNFYLQRGDKNLPVEKEHARMKDATSLGEDEVRQIMLQNPFEKFERRRYMKYDRDLAYFRFEYRLWRQIDAEGIEKIRLRCHEAISGYYHDLV